MNNKKPELMPLIIKAINYMPCGVVPVMVRKKIVEYIEEEYGKYYGQEVEKQRKMLVECNIEREQNWELYLQETKYCEKLDTELEQYKANCNVKKLEDTVKEALEGYEKLFPTLDPKTPRQSEYIAIVLDKYIRGLK